MSESRPDVVHPDEAIAGPATPGLEMRHHVDLDGQVRRRYFGVDAIRAGGLTLYNPATMRILRFRHPGGLIPNPCGAGTESHPRFGLTTITTNELRGQDDHPAEHQDRGW